VNLYAYDAAVDAIDMLDALHPQTILAYGMNGRDLPVAHGAPVRLRVETQLGYKSVKYLQRVVVTEGSMILALPVSCRAAGPGTRGYRPDAPTPTQSSPTPVTI
jgi:DMSO/TMAO reductase YedYZ molybdopterin-dependent catalytic subunit